MAKEKRKERFHQANSDREEVVNVMVGFRKPTLHVICSERNRREVQMRKVRGLLPCFSIFVG